MSVSVRVRSLPRLVGLAVLLGGGGVGAATAFGGCAGEVESDPEASVSEASAHPDCSPPHQHASGCCQFNDYNCFLPTNPHNRNRIRNPAASTGVTDPRGPNYHVKGDTFWPLNAPTAVYDGLLTDDQPRGTTAGPAEINYGIQKSHAGVDYVYAWYQDIGGGQRVSGWIDKASLHDPLVTDPDPSTKDSSRAMGTAQGHDPKTHVWKDQDSASAWVVAGSPAVDQKFANLKVTPGYAGGGEQAVDYLHTQDGGFFNLLYNLPAVGGMSVDTFPLGRVKFRRSEGVEQVAIPLFEPGSDRVKDELDFVYGYVESPVDSGGKRFGWVARVLLVRSGGKSGEVQFADDDKVKICKDACCARCCDSDYFYTSDNTGDQASCVAFADKVCERHGHAAKVQTRDTTYRAVPHGCVAECEHGKKHRLDNVSAADCARDARAFCEKDGRGGLKEALMACHTDG